VISPEGCASILWKSAERAADAAEGLAITAQRLKSLDLIDHIVPEPAGGAHRDPVTMMANLKPVLETELARLMKLTPAERLTQRRTRLASYGPVKEAA
jgi:acetyl-CoA carboxylase carboxyl transferase subunit alpha